MKRGIAISLLCAFVVGGGYLFGMAPADTLDKTDTDNKPGTHSGASWALAWSDEFDGPGLDPEKWRFETNCWGGGNEEKQCYTDKPANAFVKNGHLHIVARQEVTTGPAMPVESRPSFAEPGMATKTLPYSSARLTTKGKASWTYGRFEFRAKLPGGQGVWPAIWMLPADDAYGAWAASGEIDIMEAVNLGASCPDCTDGIENRVFGTLHYGGEWPANDHKGTKTDLPPSDDGFHIFATEWKEGEISWFVDGRKYATLSQADWFTRAEHARERPGAPFDQPFYLILNVAVGGTLAEGANGGGINPEGFPKTMEIDWVRIYQADDTK